jgi:hypothetical protein
VKGLTRGRPTARWPSNGWNGGGGRCAGERLTRAKREAMKGKRRGGAVRGAPGGFYRAGEGAHAPGDGGERAAALMAVCASYQKRGRRRWPIKEG